MSDNMRPCWQNCFLPDDKDEELAAIDAMEDSLAPLDDEAVGIRWLITRFESCYHEADKEAELIVKAIGSGQAPKESGERPPQFTRILSPNRPTVGTRGTGRRPWPPRPGARRGSRRDPGSRRAADRSRVDEPIIRANPGRATVRPSSCRRHWPARGPAG